MLKILMLKNRKNYCQKLEQRRKLILIINVKNNKLTSKLIVIINVKNNRGY